MAVRGSSNRVDADPHDDDAELSPAEIDEIITDDDDDPNADHPMSDGDDDAVEEDTAAAAASTTATTTTIEVENDSKAYFDGHSSSIFSISAHPANPSLFLTGGGDDVAYIWTTTTATTATPADDAAVVPRECKTVRKLDAHADSVVATAFTAPDGAFALTAGLDGAIHLYAAAAGWALADRVQEVDEVIWMAAHPHEPAVAVGCSDGSVWLYDVDSDGGGGGATATAKARLAIRHAMHSHTASCSAGLFARAGALLVTVSEDGSLYGWDTAAGHALLALTAADARFAITGGLFSLAVSPSGAVAAVGGATGEICVVGLPAPDSPFTPASTIATTAAAAATAREKRTSSRPQPGGGGSTGGGQAGQMVARMQAHSESVESLSFHPSIPLLASGSVDGTIALYDAARGYAVRHTLHGHVDAVVKVDFAAPGPAAQAAAGWVLTSCGIDGSVRRWDARAGVQTACLRGHLGGNGAEGEGGVLGFVQTRDRIVTAGDDGVALVFELAGAGAGAGGGASSRGGGGGGGGGGDTMPSETA